MELQVFIMAGGSGERFWPISRKEMPKHLFPIIGDKPMLDQTADRVAALVAPENLFVISNALQKGKILEHCKSVCAQQILTEPEARNTAAVVAFAAMVAANKDPDAAVLLLPADAYVSSLEAFQNDIRKALNVIKHHDRLLTLGIVANRPSTNYGYIERGGRVQDDCFDIQRFVEKPNLAMAEKYVADGFLWNSGIIFASARALLSAFRRYAPDFDHVIGDMQRDLDSGKSMEGVLEAHFKRFPKNSFDYVIWENARDAMVMEASFDWDDVGEWTALERHETPDAAENVVKGKACLHQSHNNIVVNAQPDHIIALSGLDSFVVVHTPQATLVCPKSCAHNIKDLLAELKTREPNFL
ncbi:MAG: hypothetical protein A2Y14_00035 [Verrucomicrobia bacterium GWF2_51_19]|nr:MAG: hypothetical protein A2Y14_00035 [Verrucomicrobia bacterium GWF2_51_19]HCJ11877.1 hypothetical protein [Opitutae bacterium]